MFQNVSFMSKRAAESITKNDRVTALISITSPGPRGGKVAQLYPGAFALVHRLEFHDLDHDGGAHEFKVILFNQAAAISVLKFLKQAQASCTDIIVHCEAGISRSAAVAKFIAYLYNLKFPERYSIYNRLVFSTLMTTYYSALYEPSSSRTTITPTDLPGFIPEHLGEQA